jgi:hypothetical protein
MNERIKELAEQAKVELDKDFASGKKPLSIEKSWDEMLQEKFAELIVKECMREIQTVKDYKSGHAEPDYANGFDDGMFVAIRTIEEHFGVEEK